MSLEFPLLTKDQIECKVKQVTAKGAVVLLYKTARVDMDMLDRVVGPMNWQNSYEDIDGVLHCTISILNTETKEWISKSDCGIESRADGDGNEKKGEASDAFKRAGFRWGIGRELYSAPFTFLSVETKQNNRGGWELADKFAKFSVSHIAYNDERKISELILVDQKGTEVFRHPRNLASRPAAKPAAKKVEKKAEKPDPAPSAPVITADASSDAAPWEGEDRENITQEMLTDIVLRYTKNLDGKSLKSAAADIKKLNGGSNDFRNVSDPAVRRELYNHFWNLMNEIN